MSQGAHSGYKNIHHLSVRPGVDLGPDDRSTELFDFLFGDEKFSPGTQNSGSVVVRVWMS